MDHRMSPAAPSFEAARDALEQELGSRWAAGAQANRVLRIADSFRTFCARAFEIIDLNDVSVDVARAFISASGQNGQPAAASVQRARRSAIRSLYRSGRAVGATTIDPTADIALPPLTSLRARPLTDDEILDCRAASIWSLGSTRRSATFALAEATCRSGEIPLIRVGDIDVDRGLVSTHGGGRCAPRTGRLTAWGVEQLHRRIDVVGAHPSTPVVYDGDTARLGGLVSANATITQVLQRAGLADEPDIRPSSVVAWAGAQVLASTGRIEEVAKALGLRSLDNAAKFIGWDSQEPDAEASS